MVKAEGRRSDRRRHAFTVSRIWCPGVQFIAKPSSKSFRLEKRPSIQLICVGPVIDLYGRFAAEKLARLMELYPDRVYSKPEFTALPPYLFSGADFALIPSRDEPFGLVAVEFGRKGALGVGSRLGGLGLMPGWVRRTILCLLLLETDACLAISGSLSSQVPQRICCRNCPRLLRWHLSRQKKNELFCVPALRFSVSLSSNGVNEWKTSTNVASTRVVDRLAQMPGERQIVKYSLHRGLLALRRKTGTPSTRLSQHSRTGMHGALAVMQRAYILPVLLILLHNGLKQIWRLSSNT